MSDKRRPRWLAASCVWVWLVASNGGVLIAQVDFAREILPVLSDRCFRCHGPDEGERAADLRLDQAEAAHAPLPSGGQAIVSGDPAASALWQRVTHADEQQRMPPADVGPRLSSEELNRIERWIREGGSFAQHWSFVPPVRRAVTLPREQAEWSREPLDRYVAAAWLPLGLGPNPAADRATWLRRMSLDLTGLPPTWVEVEAFQRDSAPDAYERAVDRRLASPAYGERWAYVWLDLARFADSAGYAQDPPRSIWRYRDWVIDAFNANMPFDQFTIEQLAGDLLPAATSAQRLATAFHRNTMTNSEGGTDDEEFRSAAIVDRVNTTMQVWMGLTMGCAQCHTHKYDPLTQTDYFRFYAVFNNTADADRGDESPLLEEPSDAQLQRRAELDQQLGELEQQLAACAGDADHGSAAPDGETAAAREKERAAIQAHIAQLRQERDGLRGVLTPILEELPADARRTTYIQLRGNFLNRGEQVEPGVPAAFPPLPPDRNADRLAVAEWLVSPQNPLTARVTVNRLWEQLFGIGLVETSEDFGLQGSPPSHPGLLDALAIQLIQSGWDLKALLRSMVLSSTYRQSSVATPAQLAIDPDNRWLARGPSHRWSAEMIRDAALFVSGRLEGKLHGPSVRPLRPNLGLNSAFGSSTDWEPSAGADRYRRGLYTEWRRTTPYPSFTTLDAPSREVCTIRRIRTNTPLQALVTLNDPAFVEAAVHWAAQWRAADARSFHDICVAAFQTGLGRAPLAEETERLAALHADVRAQFARDPASARQLIGVGVSPHELTALTDEQAADWAAMTIVANVVVNLDEFLSKK